MHVMAHSQGGLITSRALVTSTTGCAWRMGCPRRTREKAMSKLNVETFGAAAMHYPDGPNYVHYVNTVDAVPVLTGLGDSQTGALNPFTHPGKDAKINWFTDKNIFTGAHNINDTYLNQRVPVQSGARRQFLSRRAVL